MVLLPQLIIVKSEFHKRAEAFVRKGGVLVLTCRSAVKDADNNIPFGRPAPVGFTGLAGVTVAEAESLQDLDAFPLTGQGFLAAGGAAVFSGIC